MSTASYGLPITSARETMRAERGALILGGLAVVVAGAYGATLIATEGEPLLVAPLIGGLVGLAVFIRPEVGLYLLFGAAILLEQWQITGLDPLTARTHFFQNISGFSSLPIRLSASDLLALITLASWALRRLVGANPPMRTGPLAWAIAGYSLAFVFGAFIGFARGGGWDEIATLAELRGPIYACLLYFLTANLVRERGQVVTLLWALVLLVGVKALQGIANYVELVTRSLRLEAVTSHEDVVFFDVGVALFLVMAALRYRGRLFYALLALQPIILLAELLTQRRVAFVALAAALAITAVMVAVDRPRLVAAVGAFAVVAFLVYAAAFWDHKGPLSEPVRVIRELVDPHSVSDRDRLSNVWREIENANIAFSMRQLPLTGVGLGQPYLFQREPPALTAFVYWRYMTHNALLWVWLKAGPIGAFALWFLVARAVMVGVQLYRRHDDPLLRVVAALPVLLISAQIVFSAVDLGLTYNRNMIFLGVALGLAAPLAAWAGAARYAAPARTAGPRQGTSPFGSAARLRGLPPVSA